MPELGIWKNQQISRLRRDMDHIFEKLWNELGQSLPYRAVRHIPSIDLVSTEDNLIVKAEIPGIDPDDLVIEITDHTLTVRGETRDESVKNGQDYHRTERRYGAFSRSIHLPCRIMVEDVEATYDKGILTIVMPKCRSETTKRVKISLKT